MEFVENLAQLSDKLLKYQREEKRIFEVELQRQKDGVRMVSAASYDIFDMLMRCGIDINQISRTFNDASRA